MPRPPPSSTLFPYTTLFRSRTQVLPTSAVDVRRLARTLGMTPEQFTTRYQRTRRRVRQLHEEIFYRPLLVTSSRLSDGQITLSPQPVLRRLGAEGDLAVAAPGGGHQQRTVEDLLVQLAHPAAGVV